MAKAPSVNLSLESSGALWASVRVRSVAGREAISELFSFDLDVACDAGEGLPDTALPGEDVTLVIEVDGAEARRIHGLLGPMRNDLSLGEHATYHLSLVPRVTRLALVETQDVYLGQSVPDILRAKLTQHGFDDDDFELRLLDTYPARELVVQHHETDLAFLRRLAEHVGISFYFEHGAEREKLVFTDHAGGFAHVGDPDEDVSFQPNGEARDVFALALATDILPTSYIVQDYNYRTPLVDLSACHDVASGLGGGIVEYGSHVKTPEEAERMARIRAEERACRERIFEGKSTLAGFFAGGRMTLVDHPRLEGPEPLLLIEVTHEIRTPVFDDSASAPTCVNRFRAVSSSLPFRPLRSTKRPNLSSVVTGIIQPGPDGQTGGVAKLDSEGRYTVQLHFDNNQYGQQKASHPMRMAQPFAGPGYGMHFPLRAGTEVLIAFTNGDPDRPIIVGALYNATSPSPVVAANANMHQIRSATGSILELSSQSTETESV